MNPEILFKILTRDGHMTFPDLREIVEVLPSMPVCIDFMHLDRVTVRASEVEKTVKDYNDYPKQIFIPANIYDAIMGALYKVSQKNC